MRALVGPTDFESFDNPTGALVIPHLKASQFETVIDFGCGCGRIARQLIQQRPTPRRYVGIDLHRGMVAWCKRNLTPHAPNFEFRHHDVFELGFNPNATDTWRPFPVEDSTHSLLIASSVFTHVNEEQAARYLAEARRVLRPEGVAFTTWFLFDKRDFPMMQPQQNSLFINAVNWTNAVIFDREWFLQTTRAQGLTVVRADPPAIKGMQWSIHLTPVEFGAPAAELPPDVAPQGATVMLHSPASPHHLIGLDTEVGDR